VTGSNIDTQAAFSDAVKHCNHPIFPVWLPQIWIYFLWDISERNSPLEGSNQLEAGSEERNYKPGTVGVVVATLHFRKRQHFIVPVRGS